MGKFTAIPLQSAKPASEVFRMEVATDAHDREVRLEEFLSNVRSTELRVVSVENVLAEVEANADISPAARTEIRECLEEAMK